MIRKFLLAAMLTMAGVALPMVAGPAFADLASDKVTVDAAKAAGTVGEQGDGYLGFVHGSADAATTQAVNNINGVRAGIYADTAAKSGVTRDAAGQAAAGQLLQKVAPGQYYKPLGGNWTKK